jgi:hypothetical protein
MGQRNYFLLQNNIEEKNEDLSDTETERYSSGIDGDIAFLPNSLKIGYLPKKSEGFVGGKVKCAFACLLGK